MTAGRGRTLFISLHHNASSRESANFTSVWYHGECDWSEVSLDVAKYVGHQLGMQMRTQVAVTSPLDERSVDVQQRIRRVEQVQRAGVLV